MTWDDLLNGKKFTSTGILKMMSLNGVFDKFLALAHTIKDTTVCHKDRMETITYIRFGSGVINFILDVHEYQKTGVEKYTVEIHQRRLFTFYGLSPQECYGLVREFYEQELNCVFETLIYEEDENNGKTKAQN